MTEFGPLQCHPDRAAFSDPFSVTQTGAVATIRMPLRIVGSCLPGSMKDSRRADSCHVLPRKGNSCYCCPDDRGETEVGDMQLESPSACVMA